MSITIREIRDDTTNPDIRLADVLRKAKVLAYRLNVPDFKQWVDHELDGYSGSAAELPDYRHFPTNNYGSFSGFGGAQLKNYPIPTLGLPDFIREYVETLEVRQGAAVLEGIQFGEESSVRMPWPPNLVAVAGDIGKIVDGYALVSAYQLLGKNQVDAILDTIRNRLLTFMLELEAQFPEKAKSEEAAGEIPTERSAQIFQTHVYGGQNVIASGQDITQQTVFPPPEISVGDLDALLGYIQALGVTEEDIADLREALKEDETPSEPTKLGPRTTNWLGRIATKGVESTTTAAIGQVVQYAVKAIAQYYGVDLGT